jgi:hypothetical protein
MSRTGCPSIRGDAHPTGRAEQRNLDAAARRSRVARHSDAVRTRYGEHHVSDALEQFVERG